MIIGYAVYFIIALLYFGFWAFARNVYRRYKADDSGDFVFKWFMLMGTAVTIVFFIFSLSFKG